jgi:hypothetical protein
MVAFLSGFKSGLNKHFLYNCAEKQKIAGEILRLFKLSRSGGRVLISAVYLLKVALPYLLATGISKKPSPLLIADQLTSLNL